MIKRDSAICSDECARQAEYAEILRSHGLKHTHNRAAILGYLEMADQPVCAEQIYDGLKEQGLAVNLSTVYRTLESLCEAGLVRKFVLESPGKALFEYNDSGHRHHLVCLECKKIIPISSCPLGGYEQVLESETGYAITGHKLNVYGYCPACKKR